MAKADGKLKDDGKFQFEVEGKFLAFVTDKGKIKYLRVVVENDEVQIKLSKQARASLLASTLQGSQPFQPWDEIHIFGETKHSAKQGQLQFKAHQIHKKDSTAQACPRQHPQDCQQECQQDKVELRVCHKTGCQRRGGKQHYRAIEAMLRDRNLHSTVTIQETGCLGKCSKAPNVVMMPGKKRLSGMTPAAIVDFIESELL